MQDPSGDIMLDTQVLLHTTCNFFTSAPNNITMHHVTVCIDEEISFEADIPMYVEAYIRSHYESLILDTAYHKESDQLPDSCKE